MAANKVDVVSTGPRQAGFVPPLGLPAKGPSVLLLEPTDHIGGLNTGGLSHCDSNQMARSTVMGLFDEWHARVVQDLHDRGLRLRTNPAVKDQSRWTL